jgi:hypothetical protein
MVSLLSVYYYVFVRVMQSSKWTAMMCACVYGHVAVVEWLLKHGANIDYGDTVVSINSVIYYPYKVNRMRRLIILSTWSAKI